MKKFLLFVSTVFLSLFIVNNKVYAQQPQLPDSFIRAPYSAYYYEREHDDTYEFTIEYLFENIFIEEPDIIDYYFVTIYSTQPFYKGYLNRNNSYILEDFYVEQDQFGVYTLITLRVTVDRALIDDEYGSPYTYENIIPFFRDDSALYVKYRITTGASEYYRGYNDGYEIGYSEGYDEGQYVGEQAGYVEGYNDGYADGLEDSEAYQRGYDDGYDYGYLDGYFEGLENADPLAYERGYNDGYDEATNKSSIKFMSNIQVWLVPAIIIVVIAGIFVGYRRERYGGE